METPAPSPAFIFGSGAAVDGGRPVPAATWLRSAPFDLTLIIGVAALALLSGALVTARPNLFLTVLFLDIWLLGQVHVISTFLRLASASDRPLHRNFLAIGLLVIVGGATAFCASLGPWLLRTLYFYWQWFHYTRQSYGIARLFAQTAPGRDRLTDRWSFWTLHLVSLWGILHRSHQQPGQFLGSSAWYLPVPEPALRFVAALSVLSLAGWATRQIVAIRRGRWHAPLALYLASHLLIVSVAYLLTDNVTHGWLIINIWHNAQYILLVWWVNNRCFQDRWDHAHRWLSVLSQRRHVLGYVAACLGLSAAAYAVLGHALTVLRIPTFTLIVSQTINFHHYLIDGMIWRTRRRTATPQPC